MLNVGLLGAGKISVVHATSIAAHAGSRLVAVSDPNAEAAARLAGQYGAETREAEAIFADPVIGAVVIASSTPTHSDLIERGVAAGKAVFCEKPVDLSLERALDCERRIAGAVQPVMIGFNRRFDPNFATLQQALAAGEIGKSEMLSITSLDPAPPPLDYIRVSGGQFRDQMIHDFDMAQFLMSALPETVTAIGSALTDPEIGRLGDVDTSLVTLRYSDGRMAVIRNSRRAGYGFDQRIEVLGSDGLLQAGNMVENTVTRSTRQGVSSAKPTWFYLERYMPSYAAEWAGFVAAVEAGAPPPVTLRDGITALAMAEAATRSAANGSVPVRLADILPG